jgi:hypothetical protein
MKNYPITCLALAAAILASCSITKDAQRGISFEFQQRYQSRHSDAGTRSEAAPAKAGVPAKYQVQESALETAFTGEGLGLYPTTPEFVDPTMGANEYFDEPKIEMESIDQAPMIQEVDSPSPVTPAIDAAEDEPSILKAWIMWGIPVLLMFFGIGFLLNFGLHWYYLGKMRRASKSTYIWALTLSASLVAAVLNWLELSILAALVGIFVLLPLVAIQLIRVIKDASLLNKMAKRAARNPFKANQRSA